MFLKASSPREVRQLKSVDPILRFAGFGLDALFHVQVFFIIIKFTFACNNCFRRSNQKHEEGVGVVREKYILNP